MRLRSRTNEHGFTIVELMVALSILSVLLLTATLVMMQIGKLYSKGINAANLQNTARNVTSDFSSALQFGDQAPAAPTAQTYHTLYGGTVTVNAICFGTRRYSYVAHQQLSSNPSPTSPPQTYHALWQDTMNNPGGCNPVDLTQPTINEAANGGKVDSGRELVPERMRLTELTVNQTTDPNVYSVTIGLAYGDNDLLDNPNSDTPLCKGGAGQEFCATSVLTTYVERRLN